MKVISAVEKGVFAIVDAADQFNDAALHAAKHYRGKAAAEKALAKLNAPPAPKKAPAKKAPAKKKEDK